MGYPFPTLSKPAGRCDWRPVFLGWCVASAYLLASGWTMTPIPTGDGGFFIATSVRYAQGLGLTNPLNEFKDLDPRGQDRLVNQMPLFPWLVGAAMPTPHPRWAFVVIALLRLLQLG